MTRRRAKAKRLYAGRQLVSPPPAPARGGFVEIFGDTFYRIENYDQLAPFFVSVVSDSDHWLFVSTTGCLSAGRVSPDNALFPYYTVDRIHDNAGNTGPFTVLHVQNEKRTQFWQPFQTAAPGAYRITRNLYKNTCGNKIVFEETNHDLGLAFRYSWATSDRFGFVRESHLTNLGDAARDITVIDGLLNILPAGANQRLQQSLSYLVDAYKSNELIGETRLAVFTLAAGIVDEAIPMESLNATTVWSDGLSGADVLLAEPDARAASRGEEISPGRSTRGLRGAYVLHANLSLGPDESQNWRIVADLERDQKQVAALHHELPGRETVEADVRKGQERLLALVGGADGLQKTADQLTTVHHFANTLFNCMRGGVFADGDRIGAADFAKFVQTCNAAVSERQSDWLASLPATLRETELREKIRLTNDRDLTRIFFEYLPITFSRRHGDPSRPWNRFAIKLKDKDGAPLLAFEGNWRDIFQNWEALSFSCPAFLEHMIAKFVNASTIDGYNPYRITRGGIEWEEPDPHDPWASIGYWGDHQIIYLLKLLEASVQFHPGQLADFLGEEIFCYADVPYRIAPYEKLIEDPRATIHFDAVRNREIKARAEEIGADGKLLPGADGALYYITLAEKLLVPLLAKFSNFIPSGGIWMNTQRPEWNDANNALVGYGVSVVTLNYIRRYLTFCLELVPQAARDSFQISTPVCELLRGIGDSLGEGSLRSIVDKLATAGTRFRERVYAEVLSAKSELSLPELQEFLLKARGFVDQSLRENQRADGLFHSYNLLAFSPNELSIEHLPEMLEGQVAALSSGLLDSAEVLKLLRALRKSALFRADARSYLLYPNRALPQFLDKNVVPAAQLDRSRVLKTMLDDGDERLVYRDADGRVRFASSLVNARTLAKKLDAIGVEDRDEILAIYEAVFKHHAFTGRSGSMFAFEGLGSIYWHMVAKLLLATQECFFAALDQGKPTRIMSGLAAAYYEIRSGLGFNKSPNEYGAFPTDPYSHSPAHAGAQQPGMTGQVKEEVITRMGELGVRVRNGVVRFQPALLRAAELMRESSEFSFVAGDGERRTIALPNESLAFTFCQTPIIYTLSDSESVRVEGGVGDSLAAEASRLVFERAGKFESITVRIPSAALLDR